MSDKIKVTFLKDHHIFTEDGVIIKEAGSKGLVSKAAFEANRDRFEPVAPPKNVTPKTPKTDK